MNELPLYRVGTDKCILQYNRIKSQDLRVAFVEDDLQDLLQHLAALF